MLHTAKWAVFTRYAVMILVITVAVCLAAGASAGVGSEISNAIIVDTKPPVVVVDQLPEFSLFQGGDTIHFHWQTQEDHPSSEVQSFFAMVWAEDQIIAATLYPPNGNGFDWHWTALEVASANVYLDVVAMDQFGNTTHAFTNKFTVIPSVTDVPRDRGRLRMSAPAPNPFNPSTRLDFHLPGEGRVELTVFDARGRRIRILESGRRAGGDFTAIWDGRDDRGRTQSGGVYIFVLDFKGAGVSERISRKAVLIP